MKYNINALMKIAQGMTPQATGSQSKTVDPYGLKLKDSLGMTPKQLEPYYNALSGRYPKGIKVTPDDMVDPNSKFCQLPAWARWGLRNDKFKNGYNLTFGNGGYAMTALDHGGDPRSTVQGTQVSSPAMRSTSGRSSLGLDADILQARQLTNQMRTNAQRRNPVRHTSYSSDPDLEFEREEARQFEDEMRNRERQLRGQTTPSVSYDADGNMTETYNGTFHGGQLVRPGQSLSQNQELARRVREMTQW